MIEAQAQMMQQRAYQFLTEDPDAQADQIYQSERKLEAQLDEQLQ
jgi:hypothetical protein